MEDDRPQARDMEDLLHPTDSDLHHQTDQEALQLTDTEADPKKDIHLIIGIILQREQKDLVELSQNIKKMKKATRRQ